MNLKISFLKVKLLSETKRITDFFLNKNNNPPIHDIIHKHLLENIDNEKTMNDSSVALVKVNDLFLDNCHSDMGFLPKNKYYKYNDVTSNPTIFMNPNGFLMIDMTIGQQYNLPEDWHSHKHFQCITSSFINEEQKNNEPISFLCPTPPHNEMCLTTQEIKKHYHCEYFEIHHHTISNKNYIVFDGDLTKINIYYPHIYNDIRLIPVEILENLKTIQYSFQDNESHNHLTQLSQNLNGKIVSYPIPFIKKSNDKIELFKTNPIGKDIDISKLKDDELLYIEANVVMRNKK